MTTPVRVRSRGSPIGGWTRRADDVAFFLGHRPHRPLMPHRIATPRARAGFAALLAALATLGPFSIDAYLPAFAGIQASLGATPLEIQQTLSGYLFAFGLMFLFHGALSDSFGRRPVIITALAVYALASTAAAVTDSVQGLIV